MENINLGETGRIIVQYTLNRRRDIPLLAVSVINMWKFRRSGKQPINVEFNKSRLLFHTNKLEDI